jgi:nucleotide-binding universal stress UspA family protein
VQTPYRGSSLSARSRKIERILVATDFGSGANAVLEGAAMLARSVGATVHILCVLEALMYTPPEMRTLAQRDRETHPEATQKLADAVGLVHALGVQDVDGEIEFGIAVDVVLEKANSGRFDLLVVGARARGHVAPHVISRATVPVLAVPA